MQVSHAHSNFLLQWTGNGKREMQKISKEIKIKKNAITRSESALSLPDNDLDELKAKLEAMHHESDHMS